MPVVEFVGQSRVDSDFSQANTSRLMNCYREPIEGGHQIKSVLGTAQLVGLNAVFMRDMAEIGGDIYAVCGGALFLVEQFGTATNLGAVIDGESTISGNNGKVTVAAGGTYYVWDGASLSTPTGGAFSSVGSVEFLNQVTILTELNGRRFMWSDVADPLTLDALNVATAEGRDDNIIRAVVINGFLWLFKERSIEIWYATTAGYSRVNGGIMDRGLKAFGLVTTFEGGAFFVGDDGVVYITNGSGIQPVSFPSVETDISQGQARRCFYYEDEGHKFCVVQFSDRASWVYDLSTGEWHNRASGTSHMPWRVVSAVKAWGYWHVGSDLGKVLRLLRVNTDFDGPLVRRMISRTLRTGDFQTIKKLELFGRIGEVEAGGDVTYVLGGIDFVLVDTDGLALFHSLVEGDLRPPALYITVSRDTGKTWSPEKWRNFGSLGDYDARLVWRALGRARQFTVSVTISDPVELPIKSTALVEVA
jgi:hypothetical protein